MHEQQVNRVSVKALIALSLTALLTVLLGYTQPPQPDEGTLAHIFQLSLVMLGPTILVFLATADWKHPWQAARSLAIPGVTVILAFAALFYLEHYHYR